MEGAANQREEIDLVQLLAGVYRFTMKNWLIVFLSIVICLSISWVAFVQVSPVYESRMVVYSEFLPEASANQFANNLDRLAREDDHAALANKLGITPGDAGAIRSIKIESPTEGKNSVRETEKLIFTIVVRVTDTTLWPKLQQGIVNDFENSEFIKLQVNQKKKGYQAIVDRIKQEIGDPSPLTSSLYLQKEEDKPASKKQASVSAVFDPITLRVYMQKELADYEEKLALTRGIRIIDGFNQYHIPISPKLAIYLASGLTSGIFCALLLLMLRAFQRELKKYPG